MHRRLLHCASSVQAAPASSAAAHTLLSQNNPLAQRLNSPHPPPSATSSTQVWACARLHCKPFPSQSATVGGTSPFCSVPQRSPTLAVTEIVRIEHLPSPMDPAPTHTPGPSSDEAHSALVLHASPTVFGPDHTMAHAFRAAESRSTGVHVFTAATDA